MSKVKALLLSPLQRGEYPFSSSNVKLAWLQRLRWIAIIFLCIVIIPAQKLALLPPNEVPLYLSIVGLLSVLNIITPQLFKKINNENNSILFQLSTDILCLSLILALMGGAWNPMTPLLYFHAVLGALLLHGRTGWIFFSILVFCFVSLNAVIHLPPILEASPIPRYIQLPCQLLVVLSIWTLTGWVSRQLQFLGKKTLFLEEQKNRLDKLRAAGALAAGFSHEFATPLNTLKIRLDRIFRKHPVTQQDQTISLEALAQCENILKKMSASHSAKEGIRLEKIKISKFCSDITLTWNEANAKHTIQLINNLNEELECYIAPLPFTKTLLTLFDNAKEAHAAEIILNLEKKQSSIVLTLLDSGPGWPEIVKKHFGEPFISLKERGSGLGLYNAKTLAEALGGSLQLFNGTRSPYTGAGIEIKLPIAFKEST